MTDLKELINTVPLFEPTSSLNGIQPELTERESGGSLYFGTGLTTAKALSVGVPFDVVGMLCVAKKFTRCCILIRLFNSLQTHMH